jgi:RNA polymerase sigma factor (sigma-70 family)
MISAGGRELAFDRQRGGDFSRHLSGIRAFFATRVPSCDVDDMIQEVALRMQVRRERSEITNHQAYLFQVAHSVLTDRARRDQVRHRADHAALEEIHHPVEECSPLRVLEGREQLALLLEALKELPDRTRQAFVLHRFEEMSYAAIARHLGVSVSAVEKHIMKAIRHLTTRIGE